MRLTTGINNACNDRVDLQTSTVLLPAPGEDSKMTARRIERNETRDWQTIAGQSVWTRLARLDLKHALLALLDALHDDTAHEVVDAANTLAALLIGATASGPRLRDVRACLGGHLDVIVVRVLDLRPHAVVDRGEELVERHPGRVLRLDVNVPRQPLVVETHRRERGLADEAHEVPVVQRAVPEGAEVD